MADTALSPKSVPSAVSDRRITIWLHFRMSMFLDLVSKYTARPKVDLYAQIWDAGLQSVFGITAEELKTCDIATVPHDVTIDRKDLQGLTDMICGE